MTKPKEIKCECGSVRIMRIRIDSDWAYGTGWYEAVNDPKYYTKLELNYDGCNRPDIDVYHCLECGIIFE